MLHKFIKTNYKLLSWMTECEGSFWLEKIGISVCKTPISPLIYISIHLSYISKSLGFVNPWIRFILIDLFTCPINFFFGPDWRINKGNIFQLQKYLITYYVQTILSSYEWKFCHGGLIGFLHISLCTQGGILN